MSSDNQQREHIQVAQLFSSADAHILRGLLEVSGITVFIFNEGFSSLYAMVPEGITLHVPSDQLELARPIVDSFFDNLKEESLLKCPNCDSTNLKHNYIRHIKYGIINLVLFLIGSDGSKGIRKYKECLDCGYEF